MEGCVVRAVAVLLAVVFVIMVVFEGDRVGEGTAVGGIVVCGVGDVGAVVLIDACDVDVG